MHSALRAELPSPASPCALFPGAESGWSFGNDVLTGVLQVSILAGHSSGWIGEALRGSKLDMLKYRFNHGITPLGDIYRKSRAASL